MHWLDFVLLLVLGVGAFLGARSGLLWQVARVITFFLAIYACIHYHGIAAGWYPMDEVSDEKYDDLGNYVYSVNTMATERTGVMSVTVTVKPAPGTTDMAISVFPPVRASRPAGPPLPARQEPRPPEGPLPVRAD